ncbi:MAG: DEAD/DEAH box helicase [Eubacteriales bacterium]
MIKTTFTQFDLSKDVLKAIRLLKYNTPTMVQEKVIPKILDNIDIIVKSQTGSGKTAAFAIPICQQIDWNENKPQAIVLTPTRELAIQVKDDIFHIGRFKRVKVAAIYGKSPFHQQQKELKQKTHVVVGTPGRVIDHMERKTIDFSLLKYLVVDEADHMLNMGFIEQVETIIDLLPKERVTILLSATIPPDIKALCDKYMRSPVIIEIEDEDSALERIIQERYSVNEIDKLALLKDVTIVENPESCVIFCNTKQKVDEVYNTLRHEKYPCNKIHGGMEQKDRLSVMNDFRNAQFRYLVTTNVAARGIDIDNISLIINYDIPLDRESYVHRIGRTGRGKKEGKAITFVTNYENKLLHDIHQFIGQEILLKEKPDKEVVRESRQAFRNKIKVKAETKEIKGAGLNKEIVKLLINSGKKAKMRSVDIVGTLCNIQGMTKDDIGIINIMDYSTHVEVINNKGDLVFEALQYTPIKGKLRKVSKIDVEE